MAVRSMLAHRLRTLLTMLGIIIGVAAVVTVVALGKGAQAQVESQINALGASTWRSSRAQISVTRARRKSKRWWWPTRTILRR